MLRDDEVGIWTTFSTASPMATWSNDFHDLTARLSHQAVCGLGIGLGQGVRAPRRRLHPSGEPLDNLDRSRGRIADLTEQRQPLLARIKAGSPADVPSSAGTLASVGAKLHRFSAETRNDAVVTILGDATRVRASRRAVRRAGSSKLTARAADNVVSEHEQQRRRHRGVRRQVGVDPYRRSRPLLLPRWARNERARPSSSTNSGRICSIESNARSCGGRKCTSPKVGPVKALPPGRLRSGVRDLSDPTTAIEERSQRGR